MRSLAPSLLGAFFGSLLALGCASPQTQSTTGSAGTSGGGNSSGSAGTTGGGNTSGSAGTTGGGNTTGSAGTSGSACVAMPTQLVNANAWNCDLSDPIAIQGAIYGYTDGASCASPQPADICTASAGCCISGTTVLDTTFAKWGCGIGMELDSSGGTAPTKSVYTGPVKCFNIVLTGSSGGNEVRVGFTQSPSPATGAVAPFTSIPAFTSGWMGQVCFSDVSCPSWAVTAGTCTKTAGDGTPVDMQIQVSAGSTTGTVGTYNLCVSSIVPVSSSGAGGSGGGTNSCPTPSSSGTITTQFGDAHVGCPKDYIVQNNAWGSTAGQTISYGPGTKLKVTDQKGTGANGAPASYPSIFTGGYNGRSTTQSGLPLAVSSISATGVSTSWTWADTSVSGSYNAAYDVWFSTGSAGDPSSSTPSGGYLMVWYYKPSDNQPIGATIPNGTVTINGKQFNIWYGTNNGKPVVSYVAAQKINSWTFPLGAFIQDAAGRTCTGTTKCLQSSWYLTTVFSGFEIWSGGVGLQTTDFGVTVP